MMEKTNILNQMSDEAIVQFIGNYIHQTRLNQNKTQATLAKEAGVNRSTVSQIENGEAISLVSLIQLLRGLNSLEVLQKFEVKKQLSPVELAKLEHKKRQRARGKGTNSTKTDSEW